MCNKSFIESQESNEELPISKSGPLCGEGGER